MLPEKKTVLFFSAHPDDEMSSAALLCKLVKNKNKVICVYLTTSPKAVVANSSEDKKRAIRKKEAGRAAKIIGYQTVFLDLDKPQLKITKRNIQEIRMLIKKYKPCMIFLHPDYDAHPTHVKVNKIITAAAAGLKVEKWFFETWTPLIKPNFIYFFGKSEMKKKLKAIRCFRSQISRVDISRAFLSLNEYRAALGNELLGEFGQAKKSETPLKYGEAFYILS